MNSGPKSPTRDAEHHASMQEAADLIQMLDITCTEMNNCAADAARDAETARKNARAASEIARRYMTRSFPKRTEAPFGFGSIGPTSNSVASTLNVHSPNRSPTRSPTRSPNRSPNRRTTRPVAPYNIDAAESKEDGYSFDEMDDAIGSPGTPLANTMIDNHGTIAEAAASSASNASSADRRKGRQIYKSPTTAERIAQSHADDVLTLSIELERAKQALKSEQRMHHQSKTALETMRSKNRELEQQKGSLQKTVDTELKEGIQNRQQLEHQLKQSNLRLQAAEEDAQLALDLAKDSAERRDEMEVALQNSLHELQRLKSSSKSPSPSKRLVRFSDEATPPPPPPPPRPSVDTAVAVSAPHRSLTPRSMVAAGRQLLMKHTSPSNNNNNNNTNDGVVMMEFTPAKSAEKRRRFRERLEQMEEHEMPSPRRLPSTPKPPPPPPSVAKEWLAPMVKLLKESGERLNLGGQWWRSDDLNVSTVTSEDEEIHLEAMTRQYCQSVEFKIERQHKDINELESLCGFLENKLVRGNDQQTL
ncbi:MAG: hypothetical protein SGBAC_011372 [Bacillariaceae sp.]